MLRTNLQKQNDFIGQDFYIGLDVHKQSWYVTIRSLGIELGHFTQAPDAAALHQYLQRNFPMPLLVFSPTTFSSISFYNYFLQIQ